MRSAQLNTSSTHIHTDTPTAHAHGPHRLCTPAVIAAKPHTAAASTHTRDGRSTLYTAENAACPGSAQLPYGRRSPSSKQGSVVVVASVPVLDGSIPAAGRHLARVRVRARVRIRVSG